MTHYLASAYFCLKGTEAFLFAAQWLKINGVIGRSSPIQWKIHSNPPETFFIFLRPFGVRGLCFYFLNHIEVCFSSSDGLALGKLFFIPWDFGNLGLMVCTFPACSALRFVRILKKDLEQNTMIFKPSMLIKDLNLFILILSIVLFSLNKHLSRIRVIAFAQWTVGTNFLCLHHLSLIEVFVLFVVSSSPSFWPLLFTFFPSSSPLCPSFPHSQKISWKMWQEIKKRNWECVAICRGHGPEQHTL